MTYYIYIIYSQSINRYYVGYSIDPWNRLEQHLSNSGDKYIGQVKDWKLNAVFDISNNESVAIRMERFIKKQDPRLTYLRVNLIYQTTEINPFPA